MKIEFWKKRPFGDFHLASNGLFVQMHEGKAYASLSTRPVSRSRVMLLSDELAAEVMGAKMAPCPNIGKLPVCGQSKQGYICYDQFSGEDAVTVEFCTVCGHHSTAPRSHRFRVGETNAHGNQHPEKEYLQADRQVGFVKEASFKPKYGVDMLGLPELGDNSILVIWKFGSLRTASRRAAELQFRDATVVSERDRFIVLRDEKAGVLNAA